ncbi:MAG TPA: MFS transporter [Dehalococcoidia bacterium]|nr:MFS transporter [Dehalococcoidia bacterium]
MSARVEAIATSPAELAAGPTNVQRIAVMTFAHFVNDTYSGYLPILLPILASALGFSLGVAALVVTASTITSSIIQPALGHVADRYATRLISVVGVVCSAFGASLLGVSPSFIVLILLVIVAGMGTAAYHPQASAMVVAAAGRRKATTMSVFLVGGNLGLAIGPLIIARVAHWNLHATPFLMIPGMLMALALYVFAPKDWAAGQVRARSGPSLVSVLWGHRSVLSLLLGVVILRSWTQQGFTTFLPFFYRHQGFAPGHAAGVLAALGITGAFGGLAGGYLADRLGQRPVIVASLLLAGPLLVALPHLTGAVLYVDAALSGILLLSSWYVLAVKGQQVLSKNVGVAFGLMLGFSIGMGGLGVIPMGIIADRVGILPILTVLGMLAPVAGLLALKVPETAAEPAGAAA